MLQLANRPEGRSARLRALPAGIDFTCQRTKNSVTAAAITEESMVSMEFA
jgi:hypothetical protein